MGEFVNVMKFADVLRCMEIFGKYDEGGVIYPDYGVIECSLDWSVLSVEDRSELESFGWVDGFWKVYG